MGRLRIFVDTNVLVSAMVFDGLELELLACALRNGHRIVISGHIQTEVSRTLMAKFPGHFGLLEEFLGLLPLECIPVSNYMDIIDQFGIVRDRYDRHILAAAVCGHCDAIITGDKDLLVLGEIRDIRILTPREGIRLLQT